MKFIIRGQNFDSFGNLSETGVYLIAVDDASGATLATLSNNYVHWDDKNLGGDYNPGSAENLQAGGLDIYQCIDPSKTNYDDDTNYQKLASNVQPEELQVLQEAYDRGEESYTVYINDHIIVTPGENVTELNPEVNGDYHYTARNTFRFKVLSDKNWSVTYYDNSKFDINTQSGTANVETEIILTPKNTTTAPFKDSLDFETEDTCTVSPEYRWSNWSVNVPETIEIPANSTTIPSTEYSLNGTLNDDDLGVKVTLSGSSWLTPRLAKTSSTTSGILDESGTIEGTCPVNTSAEPREATVHFQVAYSGSIFVDQPITFVQLGTESTISLNPSYDTVAASGGSGTSTISYTGTGSLTVSSVNDWLTGLRIVNNMVYWTASAKTTEGDRYGYVTVSDGKISAILTVKQSGADPLEVTIVDPASDMVISSSNVPFTANANRSVTTWKATSDVDWMTVSTGSKAYRSLTGNVTFDDNLTGADRVATLTVDGDGTKATRKFTQKAVTTNVKITSATALNLDSGINTNMQLTMGITGTVGTEDYSINYRADQSWISVDTSRMTNNSSGNTIDYGGWLRVSTPANPNTTDRTGNIIVEFIEGGVVKASQTVVVTQKASEEATLELTPSTLSLDSKAQSGTLDITYTGTSTLSVRGYDWMTVSVSGDKVNYSVTQNTSESARIGWIEVTDPSLEARCQVTQAGTQRPTVNVTRTLPTSKATWTVAKGTNTGTLAWKASGSSYGLKTEISSSTDVSWITLSGTNSKTTTGETYSLEQTRSISVEANSGEARTGHISMFVSFSSGSGYEEQLTVEQPKGGEEYLIITPDNLSLTKEASTQKVNFSYSEAGNLTTTTVGDAWVTGPTRVTGSGDYTYTVSANVTGKDRTTTFKYTTPSGLSKNLTFSQKADDSSTATVSWIIPDSSPKTLSSGVYSDSFSWTATGKYSGSVLPRFEYEYLINGNPSSAITMYPGDVNEQVYSDGTINIKQKGSFSVNRNALQEGLNTVQVNPKVYQGDTLLAQRTQTWLITKPKSSPSGSGSGSYDPGNPGDTDIPENYITVVNQATPFYIAEENTDFTFTAQYAGPYTGTYSINTSGVTEISRTDNSGNGIVNVLVTYRVTSSSQVTLRLSDSTTTLGYLTIPVYKVASTVYSVSDDVILSGNSGDLMTVTQNSTNRLIWNDPVYAAPGYTTVNINATQMLRELVEAPKLTLNATSPRNIDTFSVKIGSKLSNLALVDSWNKFTTGFASTYLNSEIAFNSYIPATVINGGSIEIRTPLGTTSTYTGNTKQYLDVTYKVNYCGVYRVNGKLLNVVDSDYQLFFYNESGGWSSLVPKAIANPGYQFTRSSYQLSSVKTRVYQVDTQKTWKLRTGWISEDLSDLFSSARVYLHDIKANKLYEVMITDSKYDFKTFRNNSRKLVSAEINVTSVDTQIRR